MLQVFSRELEKGLVGWHTGFKVELVVSMAKFVPIMIGVGLVVLIIAVLMMFRLPSTPSEPASNKPVGTSTLGHGGPGPERQSQGQGNHSPEFSPEPMPAR